MSGTYSSVVEAIRLETTIVQDGIVTVEGLVVGDRVEVIVLRIDGESKKRDPLRGSYGRYDNPFDPLVSEEEDWGERVQEDLTLAFGIGGSSMNLN